MNKKAFTLIELLIVIAIIGILAVAFGPSLLGGPAKARDTQRVTDLRKIANFITTEYIVPGKSLPPRVSCIKPSTTPNTIGKAVSDKIAYFNGVFPKDPSGRTVGGCVGYYYFYNVASSYPNSPYAVFLWASVEEKDNGNYPPSNYIQFVNGQSTLPESGALHIITIQKK